MGDKLLKPMIVITRPAQTASQLHTMLFAAGFPILHEPMFDVEFLPDPLASQSLNAYQAIIMTSANAAFSITPATDACHIPVIAVGEYTQEAAQHAGFTQVACADGDAVSLIQHIKYSLSPKAGPLLYLSGEIISQDIMTPLEQYGFEVIRHIVYRTNPIHSFSAAFHDAFLQQPVGGIVFFSRRTAEIFLQLYAEHALSVQLATHWDAFAASQAIADVLHVLPWRTIHATPKADSRLMVEQIDSYYSAHNKQ